MDDKPLKLREVKIEKKKFHSSNKAIDVNSVDIEKYWYLLSLRVAEAKKRMQNIFRI